MRSKFEILKSMITLGRESFTLSVLALTGLIAIFPLLEAGAVYAQATTTGSASASQQITVRQQVTAEISLTVASTSLTMLPAIAGLSGGDGYGSTTIKVITNNNAGYTITVQASGTYAMNGDSFGSHFNDYPVFGNSVDSTWTASSPGGSSRFGFGLNNNGVTNNTSAYSSCSTNASCFSALATSSKTIFSTGSPTTIGGNSVILNFHAQIPANSNPLVVEDWYTATTTITAVQS